MVGVEVARRDGRNVGNAHADLGVADRQIVGPARRAGAGAEQLGADAKGAPMAPR